MPEINIPAKVRFVLYLLAVLGGLFVQYAIDKSWFGDAEFRLWSGIATLLMLLAATKTNLAKALTAVRGTVVSETGESGTLSATLEATTSDVVDEPDAADDGLTYEESGGLPYPTSTEDGSPDRY